jgi:hypothetical protein
MKSLHCLLAAIPLLGACNDTKKPLAEIVATNPSDLTRTDALLTVPLAELGLRQDDERAKWLIIKHGNMPQPTQLIDSDADGTPDTLATTYTFIPNETAVFNISSDEEQSADTHFAQRAQADLSIRKGGHWEGREYIGGEFENVSELIVPPEQVRPVLREAPEDMFHTHANAAL